jgi:hypothetical protein
VATNKTDFELFCLAVSAIDAEFNGHRGYAGVAYFMYPAFREMIEK